MIVYYIYLYIFIYHNCHKYKKASKHQTSERDRLLEKVVTSQSHWSQAKTLKNSVFMRV